MRAKPSHYEKNAYMKDNTIKPLQIKIFFTLDIKKNISATIYTLGAKK